MLFLDPAPSGRAKCHICSGIIGKGSVRGGYAFSMKKPHRYIHGQCVALLDGDFAIRAMDKLHEVIDNASTRATVLEVTPPTITHVYFVLRSASPLFLFACSPRCCRDAFCAKQTKVLLNQVTHASAQT